MSTDIPRPQGPDPKPAMTAATQGIAKGEPHPDQNKPHDVVVVLASTSTDSTEDVEFGGFVEEIKALHAFKSDVRGYLLLDQAAANVLRKVEKPKGGSLNQTVLVISFENAEDADDATRKLETVAEQVRPLFEGLPDVKVRVGVHDVADEVLGAFPQEG